MSNILILFKMIFIDINGKILYIYYNRMSYYFPPLQYYKNLLTLNTRRTYFLSLKFFGRDFVLLYIGFGLAFDPHFWSFRCNINRYWLTTRVGLYEYASWTHIILCIDVLCTVFSRDSSQYTEWCRIDGLHLFLWF